MLAEYGRLQYYRSNEHFPDALPISLREIALAFEGPLAANLDLPQYPLVSLPAGRLTHLQMFRLGLYFYIILYSLFPELRPLLGPNGEQNRTVTFSLILLTAMRYLAGT
jgi:hypothetical protein